MKNTFFLLLLLLTYNSYAQSIKSGEITQPESVKLIESIQSLEVLKGRHLYVAIFTTSNGPGSALFPESHEVSFNLLLSVSEYDEYPLTRLFNVGPFFNPKTVRKVDSGNQVTLFIEHGVFDKRKIAKVLVSDTAIQIQQ